MLRWIKWTLIALVVIVAGASLHYYLPHHDIVRIAGTDIKRLDSSGVFDSEAPGLQAKNTRDVRFITGVYPNGSVLIYRNEDTDWSFPWYAKFNSGTLQGEAQSVMSSGDNPKWMVVRSYGWRIEMLTMFPNALSMWAATGPDQTVIPWFNIVFLTLLALIAGWIYLRIRRFKRDRLDPVFTRIESGVDSAISAVDETTTGIATRASQARGRFGRWLDTWRAKKDRRR